MARRRGSRKRSTRRSPVLIEDVTFSVQAGSKASIRLDNIKNRPPRSNIRPKWIEVQAASFVPGANAPTWSPIGFQVLGVDQTQYNTTSKVVLLGPNPRTVRLNYRQPTDWISYNASTDVLVADIVAVCVGTEPTTSHVFIRGIARIGFAVQEEAVPPACPRALQHVEGHVREAGASVSGISSSSIEDLGDMADC